MPNDKPVTTESTNAARPLGASGSLYLVQHGNAPSLVGTVATHAIASKIYEAARKMGFKKVRRSAASPMNRTVYVFCDDVKVRIADHPNKAWNDIDVHTDNPRPLSTDWQTAIEWLRGRL